MKHLVRLVVLGALLGAGGVVAVPWAWRTVFPTPADTAVADGDRSTTTGDAPRGEDLDAVNQTIAGALGLLDVQPGAILRSTDELRRRGGLGWTFTTTVVDLPRWTTDRAVERAFADWPEGADAFLTHPDELTLCVRVYVGKTPVHKVILRQPLDPDPAVDPDRPPRLAVVIDGVGDRSEAVERLLGMDQPLTVGVIPYRSHSLRYATDAARASMEVAAELVSPDLPDPEDGPVGAAGIVPLGLDPTVPLEQVASRIAEDLQAVPYASGAVVDSTSPTVADPERMDRLARDLADRGMFLLDRAEAHEGVAFQMAARHAVAAAVSTAALDCSAEGEVRHRSLLRLRNLATTRGAAVLTVRRAGECVDQLEEFMDDRRREGYQLVFASEVIGR